MIEFVSLIAAFAAEFVSTGILSGFLGLIVMAGLIKLCYYVFSSKELIK